MKIVWSKRALTTYFRVADYLKDEWGDAVFYRFSADAKKVIDQISETPNMFEASKKYKNVRRGFITEHNTLFYRIKPKKKEIELLVFWDNRSDSRKLPY